MLSELRFAFRSLARHRSFALVTGLTLALGIGSAAAIFSVTDWILFRGTKFSDDVFLVTGQNDTIPFMPWRYPYMVRSYEEQNEVIAEFSKAAIMYGNVVIDGHPVATGWNGVSTEFFRMLGLELSLGRGFLPGEDGEGSDHVVIVTHQFWQTQLGGRKDVLGRNITVGDSVCTVVGVLREAWNLPPFVPNDVFRPLTYHLDPVNPSMPLLYLLGRLRPGVTRDQAQRSLQAVKVDVPARARVAFLNDRPLLRSLTEINQIMRPEIYWIMLGAVGVLYAIACLNASNLMVVRILGQRRELSIRLGLGAGRWRIIRLVAVESVMLAVLASIAGLFVANWIFPLLLNAVGNSDLTPNWTAWTLDWRAIGVMGVLTIATSLLIVVIPVFHILRSDVYQGLKEGGNVLGENRASAFVRSSLVVLQVTFAIMLLAGTGLMIHTIHNLEKVDVGFDPAGRIRVTLGFPSDYPTKTETRLARLRQIQSKLMRIPGVRAVGFGMDILLPGYYYSTYVLEGADRRPINAAMAGFGNGYQDASGLILKRGHWLNQAGGNEIMVNETLARACWPGQDPVGQLVRPVKGGPNRPEWAGWVVAGVVADLRSTVRDAPHNYMYGPEGWGPEDFDTFIVRVSGKYDDAFADLIRNQLYAFDPRIAVKSVIPLSRLRDDNLWAERLTDSVLTVLAGIALGLTVIGVFSVVAYTVNCRMAEFGMRMALGATRSDLIRLVMRRGILLTAIGIAFGIAGSLALTRYMQSLLFETRAQDVWVLAAVGVVVLFASVLACALPAQRATKVDTARLLRSE
jgi:putative ABC transport system permease protein